MKGFQKLGLAGASGGAVGVPESVVGVCAMITLRSGVSHSFIKPGLPRTALKGSTVFMRHTTGRLLPAS